MTRASAAGGVVMEFHEIFRFMDEVFLDAPFTIAFFTLFGGVI